MRPGNELMLMLAEKQSKGQKRPWRWCTAHKRFCSFFTLPSLHPAAQRLLPHMSCAIISFFSQFFNSISALQISALHLDFVLLGLKVNTGLNPENPPATLRPNLLNVQLCSGQYQKWATFSWCGAQCIKIRTFFLCWYFNAVVVPPSNPIQTQHQPDLDFPSENRQNGEK